MPDLAPSVPALTLILSMLLGSGTAMAGLPRVSPKERGFDAERLRRIDNTVASTIERGEIPGAVVLVARRGAIVYSLATGRRSIEPTSEPMTLDTVFDLASLTKPIATATSVMLLIEEGVVRLGDSIVRHLPEFKNHGKEAITVEQLLRHRAGLIADNPQADFTQGPESAWKRISEIELVAKPGERYVYSDVGFLILGRLVERLSGEPLDIFAQKRIFRPLGMRETGFRPRVGTTSGEPAAEIPLLRIAPTEPGRQGQPILRGEVHDPRARALGGVAGHAGLFATADDLAIYAQTLLNQGIAPNGHRLLSPRAIRRFTDAGSTPPGERRALGWDVDTPHSAPRGELFDTTGFGHTGFTGTSLWVDPESETFIILLTSRLHPNGKQAAPSRLRSAVATVVASAMADPFRPGLKP